MQKLIFRRNIDLSLKCNLVKTLQINSILKIMSKKKISLSDRLNYENNYFLAEQKLIID